MELPDDLEACIEKFWADNPDLKRKSAAPRQKGTPMSLAQPSEKLQSAIAAAADNARAKAEIAIEKILQGLEHGTMLKIDQVQVDTRNFANLNVEIFFREPQ